MQTFAMHFLNKKATTAEHPQWLLPRPSMPQPLLPSFVRCHSRDAQYIATGLRMSVRLLAPCNGLPDGAGRVALQDDRRSVPGCGLSIGQAVLRQVPALSSLFNHPLARMTHAQ